MTGPYPVVGLIAELADAARGSTHQTNITIHLVNEHEVLVAIEEILDSHSVTSVLAVLVLQLTDDLISAVLIGTSQHFLRHIFHAEKEGGSETWVRELILIACRPKSVFQVVVLGGGVVGNAGITTVVVGEHQTVLGDDFTRAEMAAVFAQLHNRILQRGVVDVPHLISRQMQAHVLHGGVVVILHKHRQPHAFIRRIGGTQLRKHKSANR